MIGRRTGRVAAMAAAVVLAVGGVVIAYQLTGVLPRARQRRITEIFLRLVLIGYAGAVLVVPPAEAGLVWWLLRERRRRRRHPGPARWALLGASAVLGVLLVEAMAAGWEAWSDRLPELPTRFPESASEGSLHVVVIGGSSALGEPFRPWVSMGQIVAWRLEAANPGRRVDLTILARLGACLEDMHRELARLRRRPDIMVIYSGHNEFVARYEEQRDVGLSEEPAGWVLDALYRASLASPFCRMAYRVVSRNRLDGPPRPVGQHRLIDPPQCSPSEYAAIRADFGRRLGAIAAYCERIGCLPLLVTPPSNEGGLEPSRSVLPASVGRVERERVVAEMSEAAAVAGREPGRAEAIYRALVGRHPGFAEAHFRLARLIQGRGDREGANRHYVLARDRDGLPIRCPSDFQEAYRRVAARHPGAVVVDGPAVLRAASPTGVVDDHVIQDAHHPTLLGYVRLAEAALRGLRDRGYFPGGESGEPIELEASDVAGHFGMDAGRWVAACERTAVHYERIARYRFDPSERLARARGYRLAMGRIAAGIPPEEAGVVGLGCPRGASAGGR